MRFLKISALIGSACAALLNTAVAQTVANQIDTILARSTVSANTWSMLVENQDGSVIYYQKNPTTTKAPASNMKIVTSSTAFGLLGTTNYFTSLVYGNGTITSGVLTGDLNLLVKHDITWNTSVLGTGNSRKPLDFITTQLKNQGITSIQGNVQVYGACMYNHADTDDTTDVANQASYNAEGAVAFVAALQAQGITISGSGLGKSGFSPPGTLLYTYKSTNLTYSGSPLRLDVACIAMAKVSHNVMADLLLRHIGYDLTGTDSFAAGKNQVCKWLANNIGLATNDMVMLDGSGLSHSDRFSAREIQTVTRYMLNNFSTWGKILPIGCTDGTLASRFCSTDGSGKVHAKTGSLSISIDLSGYVDNPYDNRRYFFSFLANNSSIDQANTRQALDDAVNTFTARLVPISPHLLSVTNSSNNSLTVTWSDAGFVHTGYKIYGSSDGTSFTPLASLTASKLNYTETNLPSGIKRYYKVTVIGTGGESPYSQTYAAQVGSVPPPIVVIDGNDRWQVLTNDNPKATNHAFVALTAQNISGPAFDSAYHESIADGTVPLTNYDSAIWLSGTQSTADESFPAAEQTLVKTFQDSGGNLFVSGSEIGWDLDRTNGPTAADRVFYHNQFRSVFGLNTNDDAGTYNFTPLAGGIFNGNANGTFDNGTHGTYDVAYPDNLLATNGSIAAINYSGGSSRAAAIQYDGSLGGGKTVYWGFPFETVTNSALRDAYMSDILNYFNLIPPPQMLKPTIVNNTITLNWTASAGLKYRVEYKNTLNDPAWTPLTPDITATGTTASKNDTVNNITRFYHVIMVN